MKDQELIYLIKYENSKQARDIINNKYLKPIWKKQNHLSKLLSNNTAFDYYDLDITPISVINKTIEDYDVKRTDFNFSQSLWMRNKSLMIRSLTKYFSKKNYVLNNAFEYNENINYQTPHEHLLDKEIHNKIFSSQQKAMVYKFLEFYNPQTKKVIDLRLKNVTIKEIAKTMRFSVKKINSIVYRFLKSAKKKFNEEIKTFT